MRVSLANIRSFSIMVHGLPAAGECRVDSSMNLTLDLAEASDGQHGYRRVGGWKWLKLPEGMFSKQRQSGKAAGTRSHCFYCICTLSLRIGLN